MFWSDSERGETMKRLTITTTPEEAEALRKLAAERGQTLNATITEAIKRGLEEQGASNGKKKVSH